MINEDTPITIKGNTIGEPKLTKLGNGTPFCKLRVAVNPQYAVRGHSDLGRDLALFFTVEVVGKAALNVATIPPKTRIVAEGFLRRREWVNNRREKKEEWRVADAEVAVSARYGKVVFEKLDEKKDKVNN